LTFFSAALLGVLGTSWAETNSVSVVKPANGVQSRQVITTPQPRVVSSNLIVKGKATYGGVAVQAVRVDNPLQLINPFAPAEYGSGYDNVVFNLSRTRPEGIALLSINF